MYGRGGVGKDEINALNKRRTPVRRERPGFAVELEIRSAGENHIAWLRDSRAMPV
jgi:hypothetical protein